MDCSSLETIMVIMALLLSQIFGACDFNTMVLKKEKACAPQVIDDDKWTDENTVDLILNTALAVLGGINPLTAGFVSAGYALINYSNREGDAWTQQWNSIVECVNEAIDESEGKDVWTDYKNWSNKLRLALQEPRLDELQKDVENVFDDLVSQYSDWTIKENHDEIGKVMALLPAYGVAVNALYIAGITHLGFMKKDYDAGNSNTCYGNDLKDFKVAMNKYMHYIENALETVIEYYEPTVDCLENGAWWKLTVNGAVSDSSCGNIPALLGFTVPINGGCWCSEELASFGAPTVNTRCSFVKTELFNSWDKYLDDTIRGLKELTELYLDSINKIDATCKHTPGFRLRNLASNKCLGKWGKVYDCDVSDEYQYFYRLHHDENGYFWLRNQLSTRCVYSWKDYISAGYCAVDPNNTKYVPHDDVRYWKMEYNHPTNPQYFKLINKLVRGQRCMSIERPLTCETGSSQDDRYWTML